MNDEGRPNPYAAPRSASETDSLPGLSAPRPWSPSEALEYGFRATFKRPIAIGVCLVAALASIAPSVVLYFVFMWPPQLAATYDEVLAQSLPYYAWSIALTPLHAYLMMGQMRFVLALARGRPAGFGELFAPTRFLPFLGAYLIFYLGTAIGSVLCCAPGMFLFVACVPFAGLICDGRSGLLESFPTAWKLTQGQRWKILLFSLLAFLVLLAGYMALCVGIFIALPAVYIASAYVYLHLCGEQPAALPT